MTSDIITRFVEARPFVPFEIITVDGRAMPVPHSDFATLERFAAAVVIYDTSGHTEIVDPNLIVSLRPLQPIE